MKYRKKPVVVEAVQWTGNRSEVEAFCHDIENITEAGDGTYADLVIETLEGRMIARLGDWIIRGVKGEFYPCKPDIFAATYEAAHADAPDVGHDAAQATPVPLKAQRPEGPEPAGTDGLEVEREAARMELSRHELSECNGDPLRCRVCLDLHGRIARLAVQIAQASALRPAPEATPTPKEGDAPERPDKGPTIRVAAPPSDSTSGGGAEATPTPRKDHEGC